jgi:hypothetical protein
VLVQLENSGESMRRKGERGTRTSFLRPLFPPPSLPFSTPGRWPEDPAAFAKAKAALGLQLAGALEAGCGYRTVASEECVDVLTEGFAFR